MTSIVTRTGKGAPITQAENDANLDSLCNINEPQTGTSYTIDADDQNNVIEFSNVSAVTATLTLISTLISAIDTSDFKVLIKNIGAGIVTVTPITNTFDDGDTTKTLSQYEWMTIQTDSTETKWNIIESSNSLKVGGLNASQFLRSDIDDTTTGNIALESSAPRLILDETDATPDEGRWDLHANGDTFYLRTVNDADSVVSNVLTITRTGNAASSVTWGATTLNFSGTIVFNGTTVNATATEINYNYNLTPGTVEADKSVVADSSGVTNYPSGTELQIEGAPVGLQYQALQAAVGSSVTFSSIPTWVKRITLLVSDVSPSSSSTTIRLRLGDSGGIEATGYLGCFSDTSASSISTTNLSTEIILGDGNSAGDLYNGIAILSYIQADEWIFTTSTSEVSGSTVMTSTGRKALTTALTQIEITPSGGTFDNGDFVVLYEG